MKPCAHAGVLVNDDRPYLREINSQIHWLSMDDLSILMIESQEPKQRCGLQGKAIGQDLG